MKAILLGPGEGETITDQELATELKPGELPDPAVMARLASRYDFAPA